MWILKRSTRGLPRICFEKEGNTDYTPKGKDEKMSKKRKRRKTPVHNSYCVRVPMCFLESWNLGFLNESAIKTLTNKLGWRHVGAYIYTSLHAQSLFNKSEVAHLLTTPYIPPLFRLVGSTGWFDRMPPDPRHIEQNDPDRLETLFKTAWVDTFKTFLATLEKQNCPHIDPQTSFEFQGAYFFENMKKETLSWVNAERKNPCPCCPPVEFDIIDVDDFQNRVLNWQDYVDAPKKGDNSV